jgi:release factor glutamine methyltransferase
MTYKQLVKQHTNTLRKVTHIPQKEVEILLLYILQQNVIWLHINYNEQCNEATIKQLDKLIKKRATNYPIEYITSKATFYGENFIVEDGVLIPRPETEILVEKAEIILKDIIQPRVVEIGVGSGIISVMLALLIDDIKIVAVDINDKALSLAKQNAKKHNVEDKIIFIKSDIFTDVDVEDFDMCISNPPYIANNYKLPLNVKYEPSNALFGGDVGDELLKDIITAVDKNNIQYLLCEMGYDHKISLGNYLKKFNTKSIEFYKDFDNFDRGFSIVF